MSAQVLTWRDSIRAFVAPWMSDRPTSGRVVIFRTKWAMVAAIDVVQRIALEGLYAAMPGKGTPTALGMIGQGRAISKGIGESEEVYASRLRSWLDKHRRAGSMEAIARSLQECFPTNTPRIRIVNRAGLMVTLEQDGTLSKTTCAWDWDSVSNPERSGFWSEMWIIVYPTQWTDSGTLGDGRRLGRRTGIGHNVTREEVDLVKGLLAQWKAARSKVRTVIWTSDTALFDPATPASLPDGTWGRWSDGNGHAGGRNKTTCRYWEEPA